MPREPFTGEALTILQHFDAIRHNWLEVNKLTPNGSMLRSTIYQSILSRTNPMRELLLQALELSRK